MKCLASVCLSVRVCICILQVRWYCSLMIVMYVASLAHCLMCEDKLAEVVITFDYYLFFFKKNVNITKFIVNIFVAYTVYGVYRYKYNKNL